MTKARGVHLPFPMLGRYDSMLSTVVIEPLALEQAEDEVNKGHDLGHLENHEEPIGL